MEGRGASLSRKYGAGFIFDQNSLKREKQRHTSSEIKAHGVITNKIRSQDLHAVVLGAPGQQPDGRAPFWRS